MRKANNNRKSKGADKKEIVILSVGQEDFTIVKNPGKENMEIIMKEGKEINTYKASGEKTDGDGNQGRRIGTAYQLEDGRIIYVPDEE